MQRNVSPCLAADANEGDATIQIRTQHATHALKDLPSLLSTPFSMPSSTSAPRLPLAAPSFRATSIKVSIHQNGESIPPASMSIHLPFPSPSAFPLA